MAHLSKDEGLLKAFAEGKDIHRATAAEVFGTPLESVTGEQRRSAKESSMELAVPLKVDVGTGENWDQTFYFT
jgi:DNA polymerase I-like protein with 3'-5' exonuclease and polymerase domains